MLSNSHQDWRLVLRLTTEMGMRDKMMAMFEKISDDQVRRGFSFHKAILRVLGFDWWTESYNTMPLWYIPAHILYFAYQYFNQMGLVTFGMLYVNRMQVETDEDLTVMVKNIILCSALCGSSTKAIFIFFKRRSIISLINYLEDLGELPSSEPFLERAINASLTYLCVTNLNALTWSVYSGIFKNGELPILSIYPWDTDNSLPGYLAGYGVQVMASIFCVLTITCLDTLIPICIGVTCQHLQELQKVISKLGKEQGEKDRSIISSFVTMHNKLLRGAEMINETAGFLFVVQVFYTITHSCTIIFLVVRVSDFASIVVNVIPILTAAYIQLLLYCYFGEMLTTQFDALRLSVRRNHWYASSEEVKSSLLIIGEMCKRSVAFEGFGGVFSATHETYLQSLRESVSYYLFLKTMTGEDE